MAVRGLFSLLNSEFVPDTRKGPSNHSNRNVVQEERADRGTENGFYS